MPSFTLAEIADELGLQLVGDGEQIVDHVAPLTHADKGAISFLAQKKFTKDLENSQATAVILAEDMQQQCQVACLISDNPYLSFAKLTALFNDRPQISGIHPTAVIDETAIIAPTVSIAANVVIGKGVNIGEHCQIAANAVISDYAELGEHCYIGSNVSIYHHVRMGNHVSVHSGTVIGCDGFGFAPHPQSTGDSKWQKIYQLGTVVIGNKVEIGANSAIDRGAVGNTEIKNGVIIDNHVHIAHNCIIDENTALAAGVAMAGSTYIGKNCTFGGCVGIAGHINIADNSHFSGMTMVTGSVKEGGQYSSGTAMSGSRQWRKNAVRFNQLDEMHQRIRTLEKQLEQLQESSSKD